MPEDLGPEIQHRVEQFYYREARLLDGRDFSSWVDLFTDDTRYWIPVRRNLNHRDARRMGETDTAVIDDDKRGLLVRTHRYGQPTSWSDDPPSRTRHLITNVWVRPGDADGELSATSYFHVYRSRGDHELDHWAGERHDVLRPGGEFGYQIASRKVVLDLARLSNLSILF